MRSAAPALDANAEQGERKPLAVGSWDLLWEHKMVTTMGYQNGRGERVPSLQQQLNAPIDPVIQKGFGEEKKQF